MKLKRVIIIAIIASVSVWIIAVEIENYFNGGLHNLSRCHEEIKNIVRSLEKNHDDSSSIGYQLIFTEDMTEEKLQKKIDDCFGDSMHADIPR